MNITKIPIERGSQKDRNTFVGAVGVNRSHVVFRGLEKECPAAASQRPCFSYRQVDL